jgi:hypothetical protein
MLPWRPPVFDLIAPDVNDRLPVPTGRYRAGDTG